MSKFLLPIQYIAIRLGKNEQGTTLVESAIYMALILAVGAVVLTQIGTDITAVFNRIEQMLPTAAG